MSQHELTSAAREEIGRLTAELEQARVALAEMDARATNLVRTNAELSRQLREQIELREQAEARLRQLLASTDNAKPAEDVTIREELSVALEELQVMQEELQAAHDALLGAQNAAGARKDRA